MTEETTVDVAVEKTDTVVENVEVAPEVDTVVETPAVEVAKSDDLDELKANTDALMQSSMKLCEAMYKAAQEAQPADESSDAPKDEAVVDAEFKEVDEDQDKK